MTPNWSRSYTLYVGVALIVISNAIALAGVAWNRGGEPDSVLTLSWRELSKPFRLESADEIGGLALNLDWRALTSDPDEIGYTSRYNAPEWLDEVKLASLGFNVSRPSGKRASESGYERQLPRAALVVLEFDGPAYREALERAKKRAAIEASGKDDKRSRVPGRTAAMQLKLEETSNSRLFAVDAGLDPAALRAKYPDRTRYAIVRGALRATYSDRHGRAWSGTIEGVHEIRINVPNEFREVIGTIPRSVTYNGEVRGGPPYQVTVAFGTRFEPWVTASAAIQQLE